MENQVEIDKDEYIRNRYAAAIEYYWRASKTNKSWYKTTRSMTVIIGAAVTLIASLSSSTFIEDSTALKTLFALGTPILAAVLTITAGFSQSFQWGSAWQNMVLTAQQLQSEFDGYLVTPPAERNYAEEVTKLNQFIIIESEGFFERMLGGGKPSTQDVTSTDNGNGQDE